MAFISLIFSFVWKLPSESPGIASIGEKELADTPALRQEGVRSKQPVELQSFMSSLIKYAINWWVIRLSYWVVGIDDIGISILNCDFTEM